MGIELAVFRFRIGLYSHRYNGSKVKSFGRTVKKRGYRPRLNLVLLGTFCAAVISLLLIIGGIESNPGPSTFLQCRRCDFKTKKITDFVHHQFLHSQDRHFKFQCPFSLCNYTFKQHGPFRDHLRKFHLQPAKPNPQVEAAQQVSRSADAFQCSICAECLPSPTDLRIHLASHIKGGEFAFCPFKNCKRSNANPFRKVTTFRTHWSEYHSNQKPIAVSRAQEESREIIPPTDQFESSIQQSDHSDDESMENDVTSDANYASRIVDFMAKFYLRLETQKHVASSTVQTISEGIAKISELTQQSIAVRLRSCLKNINLDEDTIKHICLSVLDADVVHKIHHKGLSETPLMTEHLREKYYKIHFNYVAPISQFLGLNKFGKKRYVHYVPIKQTLDVVLQDKSVKKQVYESFAAFSSKPGVLSDFRDGECFKSRFGKKKSIQLIVFQDGLELVNPLGAARVKHKANGVYYTLGNLYPKCRSKVNTLMIAQLFFEKDLKHFGAEKIFELLLQDLKKLESEGIMFDGENIPVELVYIVGDNLGSHGIGGFLESFSVKYFCRYCEVTRASFKSRTHLLCDKWRTPQRYRKCLERLKEIKSGPKKKVQFVRGVKSDSVFNSLDSFHVCAPGLPPCVAHDLFLGVVPKDMALFIKYFVNKKKWFSYDTLNRRIAGFQFKGSDARDRPACLTEKKHKIIGTAVQNWNLVRFFGIIVGDLVQDVNDPVWQLYLCLKKICEFVAAPSIHESQIAYLDMLLEDYLYDLVRCAPLGASVIAKHHYIRHISLLQVLLGPLSRLWTLNFEAKHSWLRQVALTSKNFVHVTKTIIKKHQLFFAFLSSDVLFPENIECSSLKPLHRSDLTESQNQAIERRGIDIDGAHLVKAVGTPPVEYKKGVWIVLKHDDTGLHVGLIIACIQDKWGKVHFLIEEHIAVHNINFGHYEVSGRFVTWPSVSVISVSDVENYYPLNDYPHDGKRCLVLKYSVLRDEDLLAQ